MAITPKQPLFSMEHSNAMLAFQRLLQIMDELRLKCPWDKKQTMESLRHLTIEETYELSDAILSGDKKEISKELGDLLLHIVFYSKIGSESGDFDVSEVLHGICEKLIHRHPHIYGDIKVEDEEEVKQNWEKIKLNEKGNTSVLSGVPKGLPSLIKAIRIQEKARGVGFDWENKAQVWEKVEEEFLEFKEQIEPQEDQAKLSEKAEGELGDFLFSMINYARFIGINPETALERTNRKFISRFTYLEEQIKLSGKDFSDFTLKEMDVFWEEAKKLEK